MEALKLSPQNLEIRRALEQLRTEAANSGIEEPFDGIFRSTTTAPPPPI